MQEENRFTVPEEVLRGGGCTDAQASPPGPATVEKAVKYIRNLA